jgi:hypothetical protein
MSYGRAGRAIAIVLAAVALIVLVLASPLALKWFGGGDAVWVRLSNIGETYGAAAVLLSAVALLGVGLSVAIQARQARQVQIFAQREHHLHLLMMAMEQPDLFECWGHPSADPADARRVSYVNLILTDWEASWELGLHDEAYVCLLAETFFSREIGRSFWRQFGASRRLAGNSRRVRRLGRFHDLMDAAFERASRSSLRPPWTATPSSVAGQPAKPVPRQQASSAFVGGAIVGAGVGWALGCGRRASR